MRLINPLKPFIITAGFVAVSTLTYAQDKNIAKELYQAAAIPAALKEDANAVVRFSSDERVIKAPGKTTLLHHSITTILNEKGEDEAQLVLGYDKHFNSIGSVAINVYDADGKVIKKYKKSDMYDRSAMSDETLATDFRTLSWAHSISSYPVTVEIIFEKTTNSYLDLGSWNILSPEVSVQNATYKVSVNPQVGFRYKNKNTDIQPIKITTGDFEIYNWTVSNLKAIKPEEDALNWRVFPSIVFAADKFEYDGLPGDFTTWQSYGKWYQALNAEGCNLTPAQEEAYKQMTANLPTDKEKAKFLYQYLQKNTRYVSIQLGIGGLKPFPASFVDQKKYGDCKALSNYMVAMLKAVNIPAYYAIVQGGENDEPADALFPADPFNHIIVCVPFKGDTTWLECTSTTKPFGQLGTFTENRNALLITEDGGKLVNTPKSSVEQNTFKSEVHITLKADGGADAQMKILSTGEYRAMYLGIASIKEDEQKQLLIRSLHIKQPSVFTFKDAPDADGVKQFSADLMYETFADVKTGTKQFYRPQLFDLWGASLPILEKRKTDFYFEHPMQKTCVTTVDLPEGFEAETVPTNASLKFTYGNYDVNYEYNKEKNQVISTAKFIITAHAIPAAKYTEMQEYLDAVIKAQNKKLVIRKKV